MRFPFSFFPFLFFGLLAYALYDVHAHYSSSYIIGVSALFFALLTHQLRAKWADPERVTAKVQIAILLMFCICLWVFRNGVIHATVLTPLRVHLKVTSLVIVCFLIGFQWGNHSSFWRSATLTFGWMAIAGLFIAKCWTVVGSPSPAIDVFTTTTAAVKHLLSGENPYAQTYVDIYSGHFGYRPTFGYWPGVLLWTVPSFLTFGDIRGAFIVADGITLLVLYRLLSHLQWGHANRLFFLLLWCGLPSSFLILEQAWTESLLIVCIAFFIWSLCQKKWMGVGLAAGLFCATKQYGIFLGWIGLIYSLRAGRNALIPYLFSGASAFALLMTPFLIWDGPAFIDSTITVLLEMGLRLDQTSIPALLAKKFSVLIPGYAIALVNIICLILVTIWLIRRPALNTICALQSLVFIYGITFLFGKQASCNYYALLAFLVCLLGIFEEASQLALSSKMDRNCFKVIL